MRPPTLKYPVMKKILLFMLFHHHYHGNLWSTTARGLCGEEDLWWEASSCILCMWTTMTVWEQQPTTITTAEQGDREDRCWPAILFWRLKWKITCVVITSASGEQGWGDSEEGGSSRMFIYSYPGDVPTLVDVFMSRDDALGTEMMRWMYLIISWRSSNASVLWTSHWRIVWRSLWGWTCQSLLCMNKHHTLY